eukprot:2005714-Rhodomonas_salina.1
MPGTDRACANKNRSFDAVHTSCPGNEVRMGMASGTWALCIPSRRACMQGGSRAVRLDVPKMALSFEGIIEDRSDRGKERRQRNENGRKEGREEGEG